jgi:Tol biopolymer transport system component
MFNFIYRKGFKMNSKINLQQIVLFVSCITTVFFNAGCGNDMSWVDKQEKQDRLSYVPDGNIAFSRVVPGGTDIFMYGTPTDDGHNLTNLGSGHNEQPAISPDNSKLAFVSRRDGNREIYIMNYDGSAIKRLTENSAWDIHPVWSPDGTKLAFVSTRDGIRNIYTMSSLDGSNVTRVTVNARNDDSPCWSPDGKQIVFSSELGSDLAAPVPRLYTINIDGSGQKLISKTVNEHEIEPNWSDLNIITYTRSSEKDGAQIYTMKPDGSQVSRLTDGAGGWHPNWSDGGEHIVFVSDRSNEIRIYTMLSNGTNIRQLITKSGMEFEPDWGSPLKRVISY